jgi:hypothetical protein
MTSDERDEKDVDASIKYEGGDWKPASKTTWMTEVKSDALSGGVNISTWDGRSA